MAVTATVTVNLDALLTGVAGGLGVAAVRHPLSQSITYADGAGAGQVSKIWSRKAQSLALSSSETWDLSGALTDALGNAVIFTKIKALALYAYAANVNNVVLGNDAAHVLLFGAATHSIAIQPGSVFLWATPSAAGVPVTATTADLIKITNSGAGTAVVYDLAILGS